MDIDDFDLFSNKKWRILRWRYKIEKFEFFAKIIKQDGECAICKAPFVHKKKYRGFNQLCVDHDHITGEIRGLLCKGCNLALGLFLDELAWLKNATKYIEEHTVILPERKQFESQTNQVLNYMQKRGPITQATASSVFGCSRLASVIHRLKKKGHHIDSHIVQGIRGRYAKYSLKKK